MDEDWHAFCLAIYLRIEGQDWETMYYDYKELHQTVGMKKSGESQKAKALWAMKAATDREEQFYDPVHQKDILGRPGWA